MHTTKWAMYKTAVEAMTQEQLRTALIQAYNLIEEQTLANAKLQAQLEQRTAIDTILAAIRPSEFQLSAPKPPVPTRPMPNNQTSA